MEAFRKRVKALRQNNYSESVQIAILTISKVKGGKHNQNSSCFTVYKCGRETSDRNGFRGAERLDTRRIKQCSQAEETHPFTTSPGSLGETRFLFGRLPCGRGGVNLVK